MSPSRFEYILDSLAHGFGVLVGMLVSREELSFPRMMVAIFSWRSPKGDYAPIHQGVIDVINDRIKGEEGSGGV
jgi:hypothetical protein